MPSLREQKKARTRESLYEAAARLFATAGFDGVTVDEITEAAGVSRRTFFRYFPTKEAVVFPHQADRVQMFRDALTTQVEGEAPFDAVRRACRAIADGFMADKEALILQRKLVDGSPALIAYEQTLDRDWEAIMVEGLIARGSGAPDNTRRSRIIAAAAMGALRAALEEWYGNDGQTDLVWIGEEAMELLAKGILK